MAQWDKLGANNMGRGNIMGGPLGMPGSRMPNAGGAMKPDGGPAWGQPRNGAWDHDNAAGKVFHNHHLTLIVWLL